MLLLEGIVIDVSLAGALLAALVGRTLWALDELSGLDPDLYRSLTYVKHYKDSDDVADLQLTFSVDEDVLGQVEIFHVSHLLYSITEANC